ncbi:hypothetical protein [Marinobacter salarius]|nr:hypothetical protein [Marinobacter salarius]
MSGSGPFDPALGLIVSLDTALFDIISLSLQVSLAAVLAAISTA